MPFFVSEPLSDRQLASTAETETGTERTVTVPLEDTGVLFSNLRTALVLPTLNAETGLPEWLSALKRQTVQPHKFLLVDSASNDRTVELAKQAGFEVVSIKREDFSHGGTRQMCVERLADCDLIVFVTQDAVLAQPQSLANLLRAFDNPQVGAAYGRQLPRPEAGAIEAHARLFNYPDSTQVKSKADIPTLGLKTAFISNSFAAYRRSALLEAGGFPSDTIQNEDTYAASRMILNGWKVVYAGDAPVYHSHPLSVGQEFRRYFDIGVFHARAPWIREEFGQAEGEGWRFVRSELGYLCHRRPTAIPSALLRTGLKLVGYKLGSCERKLPRGLKTCLSGNKTYWRREAAVKERS